MTRASIKLRRLLPIDPDYAPFGLRWLRGLNALVFLIYVPYMLGRALWDLKLTVAFRGSRTFLDAFLEAAARLHLNLLFSLAMTMLLMIVTIAAINLTERLPKVWRLVILGAALVFCAFLVIRPIWWRLALASGFDPKGIVSYAWFTFNGPRSASLTLEALAFGCLAAAPIYLRRQRQERIRSLRDAKLQRISSESQETEARLQSLQAQIEPHFLFNTLAHIARLHQVDARKGRSMLRGLTGYMRSALPQMRESDCTLGRELALTRAYADVQQIRMGERLRVEVDVPDVLMQARVPAMTVLTLAENAVKHGLGPKREGGTLRIEAKLKGEMLEVAVCDDGVGLQLGAGTGHGLSNTRSRLEAAYGSRSALDIENRATGGVRAALVLPFVPVAAQGFAQ
jgi:hypothetical protein